MLSYECVCVCVSTRRGNAKKLTVFGLNSLLLAVTSFQMPPFAPYIPTPSSFQWQYRKRPFVCCMTNGPVATFAPSRHVLHCDTLEKKMSDKIKQKKEAKKESLENEKGVSRVKWQWCALKGWCWWWVEHARSCWGSNELHHRNKN